MVSYALLGSFISGFFGVHLTVPVGFDVNLDSSVTSSFETKAFIMNPKFATLHRSLD